MSVLCDTGHAEQAGAFVGHIRPLPVVPPKLTITPPPLSCPAPPPAPPSASTPRCPNSALPRWILQESASSSAWTSTCRSKRWVTRLRWLKRRRGCRLGGLRVAARVARCPATPVPLWWLAQGKITNTQRIDAALPTIRYALDNGAKVRPTRRPRACRRPVPSESHALRDVPPPRRL